MSKDLEASQSSSNSSTAINTPSNQPLISEDDNSSSNDDTFDMEADFLGPKEVVVAKPPDGLENLNMEGTNVTEFLDQLIEAKRISNEKGAKLKRKYNALEESINISRAAENALLKQVMELQLQLASNQHILDKADGFPDSYSSEKSQLRQSLLRQENSLMQTEEKTRRCDQEIMRLEREQEMVKAENERHEKGKKIQSRAEKMKQEIEAIKNDLKEHQEGMQKLVEAINAKNAQTDSIKEEIAQLVSAQTSLQDELAVLTLAPLGTPREIERLRKAIGDVNDQIRESKGMSQELVNEILRQKELSKVLTEELTKSKDKVDEERRKNDAKRVASESLAKNIATGKEFESTLMEDEASLELQRKLKYQEYKTMFDSATYKTKEKDKELKHLKRTELQLRSLENSRDQQEKVLEPYIVRQNEAIEAEKKRKEEIEAIRQEVEVLRRVVAQQIGYEHVEQRNLSLHIDKERYFRELSKKNQDKLKEIGGDIILMTRQRDLRSRDFYKALRELHDVDYNRKIVKNQSEDQHKKLRDLDNALREFADAYNTVKTERNKAYTQIQACQQISVETRERIKVLQNESEILQNAVDSKSKILARAQLALISKNQDRDAQNQELSKVRLHQDEAQNNLGQQREILNKISQQINSMENVLNRLRVRYEQAVQDRNDTGLQLIERNEEVCVFHEKLNVQESVCRKGNAKLMEKEEEKKFLNMELNEIKRDIDRARKNLPEKEALERDLTRCHNELLATKAKIQELEDKVCDASNPERMRHLPGEDPSCSELRGKLEKLQARLTDIEQKMLEKDLLEEQVTRLNERLQKKVDARKETTLHVGNKVNSYQSKLKDGTRKMMALVSELSLQQALAIRLQQEVNEKETLLEQAYTRLDSGEAPDEECAREWAKMMQMSERSSNKQNTNNMLTDEGEGRELPNGVYTMAESRHNAYIPESEMDLPLPKPYGAHAPFKPSQPGANMRHIKKPNPPPIDI